MEFVTNFKKSPEDKRDFIFSSKNLKIQFPNTLDLKSELQPVRNQGNQGTCYAQSVSCMKEWQEKKNYNHDEYFSPQFFYNLRSNKYDENKDNDDGMFGRDVMNILRTYGICKEVDYPYGLIQHKDDIEESLFNKAKINIINSYARIFNIEDLKLSLFKNGPALIGFPVFNYGPEMWKQNQGESFQGGHAMTIVGYDENGFIIRNSWGDNWCNEGYTCYKYEDWGSHWEIWSTVDKKDIFPETNSESEIEDESETNLESETEDDNQEDDNQEDDNQDDGNQDDGNQEDDNQDDGNQEEIKCPFCIIV